MKKNILLVCSLLLFTSLGVEAQVHTIPFASKGNQLELTLQNTTERSTGAIEVKAIEFPDWISLHAERAVVNSLQNGSETMVSFLFDAKDTAPVGEEVTLVFAITQNGQEIGRKVLRIKSEAPQKFELFHNYPNPFNPTTTISYQLPTTAKVNIFVFNILGQQVAELINDRQDAGKHSLRWDASNLASGMYIYRIIAQSDNGKKFLKESKMLLIK